VLERDRNNLSQFASAENGIAHANRFSIPVFLFSIFLKEFRWFLYLAF